MPIQFAIEEYLPTKETDPGEELTRRNSDVVYHLVSQELAENDEERGVFRLINTEGEQLTQWTEISRDWVEITMRKMKSTGGPHKDLVGEMLAVGDYVAYATGGAAELAIGKVIAFTASKIRIFEYNYYFATINITLKSPSGVIKLQPNQFSE